MDKMKITSSDPKYYFGIPGKGLITSLSLKDIRRSKNVKKEKLAITEFSIRDISKIIEEFRNVTYEGYARKRSKYMPNDSYLYLTRQLKIFTMSNLRGSVTTQNNLRGLVTMQ